MRPILVLPVVVAVLAVGLLAVDRIATGVAEEHMAAEVVEALNAPAEVQISGWPVVVRTLTTGRVPEVTVRAVDVPAGTATIDRLHLHLRDVDLDLGDVRGRSGLPPAREARFEAEIGERSLLEFLRRPEGVLGLSLQAGTLRLDVAGLEVVEARIGASGGVVIVEPDGGAAALAGVGRIPIDLSGQPGRPYVEDAEVDGANVLLRGRLEEMTVGIR